MTEVFPFLSIATWLARLNICHHAMSKHSLFDLMPDEDGGVLFNHMEDQYILWLDLRKVSQHSFFVEPSLIQLAACLK